MRALLLPDLSLWIFAMIPQLSRARNCCDIAFLVTAVFLTEFASLIYCGKMDICSRLILGLLQHKSDFESLRFWADFIGYQKSHVL